MKKKSDSESGRFNPRIALAFFLCSLGICLVMLGFAGPAPSDIGASAADPDLPKFLGYNLDQAEYIRLREEQIALLRGAEPGKPFDPAARSRAIEQMERQIAALARANENANETGAAAT